MVVLEGKEGLAELVLLGVTCPTSKTFRNSLSLTWCTLLFILLYTVRRFCSLRRKVPDGQPQLH